jgi:hypothetical protein
MFNGKLTLPTRPGIWHRALSEEHYFRILVEEQKKKVNIPEEDKFKIEDVEPGIIPE